MNPIVGIVANAPEFDNLMRRDVPQPEISVFPDGYEEEFMVNEREAEEDDDEEDEEEDDEDDEDNVDNVDNANVDNGSNRPALRLSVDNPVFGDAKRLEQLHKMQPCAKCGFTASGKSRKRHATCELVDEHNLLRQECTRLVSLTTYVELICILVESDERVKMSTCSLLFHFYCVVVYC